VQLNLLMGKHMGLRHELVPDAKSIAVLMPSLAAQLAKDDAREPPATLGVHVHFFERDMLPRQLCLRARLP